MMFQCTFQFQVLWVTVDVATALRSLHLIDMGSVPHVSVHAALIFRVKVGTVSVHVYIGLSPTDPQRKGRGWCPVICGALSGL